MLKAEGKNNSQAESLIYKLITNEDEANLILSTIINDKGCVIGVDIEAAVEMSRFGILCLIQVNQKK